MNIKELAEQAGASVEADTIIVNGKDADDFVKRFAELVAAASSAKERDACAKLCDEKAKRDFNWASENADKYHAQASWAELCSKAIRRRGEK